MSEEDLELLITLDDPEGAPEEDIFHHRPADNAGEWLRQADSRTNEEFGSSRASGGLQS